MSARMRQILKDPEFERQLSQIDSDPKRADKLLEGLEWLVSRDPESGTRVDPKSSVWAYHSTDNAAGLTPVIIYYTFNSHSVILLAIDRR